MVPIRKLLPLSLLILGLAAPVAPSPVGPSYLVIVNAKNPASSLGREQIARLFLKKDLRFADGTEAEPVDRQPDSATRRDFTQGIHGKDVAAIKSFWQRQLFSGRDSPPPELASDREVIDFVARSRGGIGYVSADASLPAGVKVLKVE
jgi:ABC-type phosphate transport system substrate-binding protein